MKKWLRRGSFVSDARPRSRHPHFGISGTDLCFRFTLPSETSLSWGLRIVLLFQMHVLVRDILMLGSVENICASDSRRRPKYSRFGICGLYSCFRFTSPSETSWFWDLRIAFVLQIDIPATPPQPPPLPQPPCQTWPHLVVPCGILIVFNSVSDLAFFSRHPHFRDLR